MNQTINSVDDISDEVIERINHLSGANSAIFWNILYGTTESLEVVKDSRTVLALLYNEENYPEAFLLIRSYFGLLGIDFPFELNLIEKNTILSEPFVSEFLLDAEDIIIDFEWEEERFSYLQ